MECPSCGAHVHPRWEHCRVCGAELTTEGREAHRSAPDEPRLVPRLHVPDLRRLGARLPSRGAVRAAASNLPRLRRPRVSLPLTAGLRFLPLLGAGVVLGLLVVGLLLLGRQLDEARASERSARSELATLQSDLRTREGAEATLRQQADAAREAQSSLLRERDEAREQAAVAEAELSRLQARLGEAEDALEERAEQSKSQAEQIAALRECLGGALVALEFARADSWRSAERAMDAVAEPCAQAGAPF